MSAWERSRHIPWSRIPQQGSNLEQQREQIFRQLQREAIEEELRLQERHQGAPTTAEDGTAKHVPTKVPYSTMEMLRFAAFGGTIGAITGTVFGFMDSLRSAGESSVLVNASNQAKGRYILQGTSRSAFTFGAFFGGFQVAKYGIRTAVDPGEIAEIGLAAAASLGVLASRPNARPYMPYAFMLIGMDAVQLYMRKG
ncbi:hypothetical protein MPSEU_000211000 [Mayamaea pseudoterrestris]|nr:hypothetical protein MPSEU_000211000 [Mayamaea pseudoterrestris]